MTGEQRRRVREVFEAAFERPAGPARDAWIAEHAGDVAVAKEVGSLLACHERADQFMSVPLMTAMPTLLTDECRFDAGETVGPYRIVRELGRGGMGVVYLATDTRLGRAVAVKMLTSSLAREPAQRERLRREARAASLINHPGVCTIYAFDEIGDECVIAAEYVDGRPLRDAITSGERPSPSTVIETARTLLSALTAAHAKGIVHRDLKPENVMCAADGQLKILDFGLALVAADSGVADAAGRVTSPGVAPGTPAYMAPEQITQAPVDARADLFALGVLLFEYATGVHPFAAATPMEVWARVLEGTPSSLGSLRPDMPPQVGAALERSLARRPEDRWASAADMRAALDARSTGRREARAFWWRSHLLSVMATYALATLAAWSALGWLAAPSGSVFVAIAMLATVGCVYRGHLLFAERHHDRLTFRRELQRTVLPLNAVDVLVSALLVGEGLWLSSMRPVRGALIGALGIGLALARLVLERSTTQAAFEER